MLRSLTAIVLGGGLALPLASPGQKPPSSLEPVHRGVVSFSHDAKRVVACNAKRDGGILVCLGQREPTDAATELELRPISQSTLVGQDKREQVHVAVNRDPRRVELGIGLWEIDWPGRNQHDRFYVADADEFGIGLRTEVGSCKKAGKDCALKTDETVLEVKIPKRCRR
jgi:hypothetical protein